MTSTAGYHITEADIVTTMHYLQTQGEPNAREDAIRYLEEKAALAHLTAHKIVEDEQSGTIEPIELKPD